MISVLKERPESCFFPPHHPLCPVGHSKEIDSCLQTRKQVFNRNQICWQLITRNTAVEGFPVPRLNPGARVPEGKAYGPAPPTPLPALPLGLAWS